MRRKGRILRTFGALMTSWNTVEVHISDVFLDYALSECNYRQSSRRHNLCRSAQVEFPLLGLFQGKEDYAQHFGFWGGFVGPEFELARALVDKHFISLDGGDAAGAGCL
jgi:hypothetical protein